MVLGGTAAGSLGCLRKAQEGDRSSLGLSLQQSWEPWDTGWGQKPPKGGQRQQDRAQCGARNPPGQDRVSPHRARARGLPDLGNTARVKGQSGSGEPESQASVRAPTFPLALGAQGGLVPTGQGSFQRAAGCILAGVQPQAPLRAPGLQGTGSGLTSPQGRPVGQEVIAVHTCGVGQVAELFGWPQSLRSPATQTQ